MIITDTIGVIADDLTGANDTALQFQLKGADTRILLGDKIETSVIKNGSAWAISTESRNVSPDEAYNLTTKKINILKDNISIDHHYKKIDSTLRGNLAADIIATLETLDYEAALIAPAFPSEGRTTVGGYQLLNGLPLERTEIARDPKAPVFESHIPTLLNKQLGQGENIVGLIELKTIMQGAGPILFRLNQLIEMGKKLIVCDAISVTDLEQLILAYKKTSHKILPTGTAALAQVLGNTWLAESEKVNDTIIIPKLPRLIISGSATTVTAKQIEKLSTDKEFDNTFILPLTNETILNGVTNELVNSLLEQLNTHKNVVVHTSHLVDNFDGFSDDSVNEELTREKFIGKITGFLAELTRQITAFRNVILITLGGETSYKCCEAMGINELQIIDEVAKAIALSTDHKNRFFVAKSGNLGDSDTLIDILNYFNNHEQI